MRRPMTGQLVRSVFEGEAVEAFVPEALPPTPPLETDGLITALSAAERELGRLDSVASVLPDADLFIYSFVRREAVLSSQIEGTQSSISDLLRYELDDPPGVPVDDVQEVSNYVQALQWSTERLAGGGGLMRICCAGRMVCCWSRCGGRTRSRARFGRG